MSIFYIKEKFGSASYNGGISFTKEMLNSIPLRFGPVDTGKIVKLVDRIMVIKMADPDTDISDLEREINSHLYTIYGLSPEEIAVVEGLAIEPEEGDEPRIPY
ncbi:hypothetical protein [Pseudomonas sp.]|uniref:hypothetical protein n=1 Tax=Pseudomonas sp. TaxID=306 RepID=UPI0040548891